MSNHTEAQASAAPGSTYLCDAMAIHAFTLVETLDPKAAHRYYYECRFCSGTDNARDHYKPQKSKVEHQPGCTWLEIEAHFAALASSSAERSALEKRVAETERRHAVTEKDACAQAERANEWQRRAEQAERDRDAAQADLAESERQLNKAWIDLETAHQRGAEAMREAWQPIETIPDEVKKNGTHILVALGPYDRYWTFDQRPPIVVHYFPDPDEPGFYPSFGIVQDSYNDKPVTFTHWQPLPIPPAGETQ